jgi:hypothetical protein
MRHSDTDGDTTVFHHLSFHATALLCLQI